MLFWNNKLVSHPWYQKMPKCYHQLVYLNQSIAPSTMPAHVWGRIATFVILRKVNFRTVCHLNRLMFCTRNFILLNSDNDTKKSTTNTSIVYNATPIAQIGQPKIQILEPPVVYKPTPKCLLASSTTSSSSSSVASYSPPVKKPKLEYVPKPKSIITSIATYVPSTTIKSNNIDNENSAEVLPKSGWDYLSDIIETDSSSPSVDKTPTYVPTKINRSTSRELVKPIEIADKPIEMIDATAEPSSEDAVKKPDDEIVNQTVPVDTEPIESKKSASSTSKSDKSKSRHDRHKSSSKLSSRSHSSSSRCKHESLSSSSSTRTSSERSKSSKSSSHRSSHDKSRSHSSRSGSKSSSVDKTSGGESKRSDKSSKSSKSSSSRDDVSKRKSKSGVVAAEKESIEPVPVDSGNISPSSVFDTDDEEDDVMAQCRMIFDEFEGATETKDERKPNPMVVSITLRRLAHASRSPSLNEFHSFFVRTAERWQAFNVRRANGSYCIRRWVQSQEARRLWQRKEITSRFVENGCRRRSQTQRNACE